MGIFPQGASPCGVLDMKGNVWEWCLNEYGNPEVIALSGDAGRVVRGGSWRESRVSARCSVRFRGFPDFRLNYIGFRLVVGGRSPSP